MEWPDKTQNILPDLFLERQESEAQSLTDSKNDENGLLIQSFISRCLKKIF